jgi:hypothetical protein
MNEWMNAGMEFLNEYSCVSVWASDWVGEWGYGYVFKLMSKRKNEVLNEWVTELMYECVS